MDLRKFALLSRLLGIFYSLFQSCTASTLLQRRAKSAPKFGTLNLTFVIRHTLIKLLKLPMFFFDRKMIGDFIQRVEDHSVVQSFLTNQSLGLIFSILNFIILGIVLCIYSVNIFLIFLIGVIAYFLWLTLFLSRRRQINNELFHLRSKNSNLTYQLISNIQEIKLHNCENRRRCEWEDRQIDLFQTRLKSLRLNQTQEAGGILINEIKNILITVTAAIGVINNTISIGEMMAILFIVGQISSPVSQLMSFIYSLQDVKISLERITEIKDEEEENKESGLLPDLDIFNGISFENVKFKYDKHSENYIIDGISLTIPKGKTTAIVGASGSGKTTLIKLMLGYYCVQEGKISVFDNTLSDYNLKEWRDNCGVVMQDSAIFSESIARNIAVDDGEIDETRLIEAAKLANIHEFIQNLPSKYKTLIGIDGIGVSQGQKQRILIARAIYKNSQIIFLDEATNSLDAQNESEIISNLNNYFKNRTVVIVAHRLSTVRNADQIIVLDKGKIIERGTHDKLVKSKNFYYNLIRKQLELGN